MEEEPTAGQAAPTGSSLAIPAIASSDFRRLARLLRLAEGAWALAAYESGEVRARVVAELRAALHPLPVIEISLSREQTDPLAILRDLAPEVSSQAPVVSFSGVRGAFPALPRNLDLHREALALLPHRLLFWVDAHELSMLAQSAPNFYSRISGVFRFPGGLSARTQPAGDAQPRSLSPEAVAPTRRRRPALSFSDERDRRRKIDYLLQRVHDLREMSPRDPRSIAETWYDLAQLYEASEPPQLAEAEAAFAQAAQCFAEDGDRLPQADSLYRAGRSAAHGYSHQAALDHLRSALQIYHLLEDASAQDRHVASGRADTLFQLGLVYDFLGQLERAVGVYEQALELYRAVRDRLGEANTLQGIGDVQRFRDEYDAALGSFAQALGLFRAVGDRLGEANTLQGIGDVQRFRKEMDAALGSYEQALGLYRAVGDRLGEANTLQAIGDVQQFRKEMDAALGSYEQALGLYRAVGDRLGEANALRAIGDVQQFRKEMDAALGSYEQALGLYRAVGSRLGEANTLAAQGQVALLRAENGRAEDLLRQAVFLYQLIGSQYAIAAQTGNYGMTLLRGGQPEQAQPYLLRAAQLFTEIGMHEQAHLAARAADAAST